MLLPTLLLFMAAVLSPSLGKRHGTVLNLSKEQQEEILAIINNYRREVQPTASNMLKMTWRDKVAESAKIWASQCIARSSPLEKRRVDGVLCGESLSQSNFVRPWRDVLSNWYNSVDNFIYGEEDEGEIDYLGYTQMMWYNSHEVGCIFVYCPHHEFPYHYMCRFCPLGNIKGQLGKPYKEGPTCGDCPDNCEDKLCTNPCKYVNSRFNCTERGDSLNCDRPLDMEECQATCNCETEII